MSEGAVLFSEMIPGEDWEDQFNHWYDTEHIPLRMKVKGFRGARRYREVKSSKYLAVYEMDDPHVLQTEDYKKVKDYPSDLTKWMLSSVDGFTRYICQQISQQINPSQPPNPFDAPILYPVMFQVPKDREEEFNRWYEEDHVPTLLECPDWLACRRYRITSGEPGKWTHLALHYLAHVEALDSEARKKARNSPWREKLAQEAWFKGHYLQFELVKTFHSTI